MFHRNRVRTVLVLGCFVFVAPICTSTGRAEQLDPTKISQQIESLLVARAMPDDLQTTKAAPVAERPAPFRPQLRGLVLRDQDHGTALISNENSRVSVVTLRRDRNGVYADKVTLDERTFVVADFSESSVILRAENGSSTILVK